jgi:hypothetical protein
MLKALSVRRADLENEAVSRATVSGMASPPSLVVATNADGEFVVRITEGKTETRHVVAVPNGFGVELGLGGTSDEDLVRASFRFLLDREPATSILAKFSLDLIPRYFPDYGPRDPQVHLTGIDHLEQTTRLRGSPRGRQASWCQRSGGMRRGRLSRRKRPRC